MELIGQKVETMAWQRPLLELFLTLIHQMFDFCAKVWLCSNLLMKKLSSIRTDVRSNIKNDFLEIDATKRNLTKIPNHIAFAFLESSISLHEVAQLVLWSIACGAKGISLYDPPGFIKQQKPDLERMVNGYVRQLVNCVENNQTFEISWNGIGCSNNGNRFTICLFSREDGQEDIVQAARKLAEDVAKGDLKVDDVNETRLEANLGSANKGLPDPEVLLRFGLAHSNQGYPPWQIRLSEIHDIDTHHGISPSDFLKVLLKYSRCEQRYGR